MSAEQASSRKNDAKALYHADYSIAKIAELLHCSVALVHKYVHEDGDYRIHPWNAVEDLVLLDAYAAAGEEAVDLVRLSKVLGRSKSAVACRANELNVTNPNSRPRKESVAQMTETLKLTHAFSEHPRGMLGKRHSPETLEKLSKPRPNARGLKRSEAVRTAQSIAMTERLTSGGNVYSSARRGKRDDLGDVFFRSSWEANVARWLTFNKRRWEYEPKTFWFNGIKRGVRSYTPDFYLPDEDQYIEVKGWMDPKSKTKLKRMAKYHPDIRIEVIGPKRYLELSSYAAVIPAWESGREQRVAS